MGAFEIIFLLQEIRREMGQTGAINAKVRATKLRRNFLRRTPPIGPKTHVLLHLIVYLGMFCYDIKLGAKWAKPVQLIQKFMRQSPVGIFCNERIGSIQLDPKLMFCCVS